MVPVERAAMDDRTVINGTKTISMHWVAGRLPRVHADAISKALVMIGGYRGRAQSTRHSCRGPGRARCASAPSPSACSRSNRVPSNRCCINRHYDLVIEVAISGRDPSGGMVHPYLPAASLEPVTYPSDAVKACSGTLSVPIFQEQVMQLAIVAAGFSPEPISYGARWPRGSARAASKNSSSG